MTLIIGELPINQRTEGTGAVPHEPHETALHSISTSLLSFRYR